MRHPARREPQVVRLFGPLGPLRLLLLTLLLLVASLPVRAAIAHDPSAWGGLYRTRDGGVTWFLANEGRFVTTALDLAIHPADSAQLLLATESGLLRSVNGGRDWDVDPSPLLRGAVYAVAFDLVGSRSMASTGSAILAADNAPPAIWRTLSAPSGATPMRQIVVGTRPNQVYVVGWTGLYRSDDWGESWQAVGSDIPGQTVTRLLVIPDANAGAPHLLAVAGGAIWASGDEGVTWRQRAEGLPPQGVDTVVADRAVPGRLWAGGADRLFRSDDDGAHWQPFGAPLDERQTSIYGIATAPDGGPLLLTTDRGLYRSADSGSTWELLADSVPVHLPARPLVSDPQDQATVYAGFSIRPYDALWQNAADGTSAFQRLDAMNLGGALAFLVLLALAGGFTMQRLYGYYGPESSATARRPGKLGRQQAGVQQRPGVTPSVAPPVSSGAATPLPESGR